MKHAYLIIAHNEWEVLKALILLLDDSRNDIYVHIDKKVKEFPHFTTKHSQLHILKNRVSVFWGDVSQIEATYCLFEAAFSASTSYSRYHLISGTHLPLKDQDYLHRYFDSVKDQIIISRMPTSEGEIRFKLGLRHLFMKESRLLWRIILRLQILLRLGYKGGMVIKASNWVSVTPKFVQYLLSYKSHVLKRFKYTLCGDEYFIPYLLTLSEEGSFALSDNPHWLYTDFNNRSNPRVLTSEDTRKLLESPFLFARKFGSSHPQAINMVIRYLQNTDIQ